MTAHRDRAHAFDILHAAELIQRFVADLDAGEFTTDEFAQSAVLHQFLVLGEATKRLTPDFRSTHSDLPWRQMAGMRDHIIHGYDAVDLEIVWRTATRDVPRLRMRLDEILDTTHPDEPGSSNVE